MPGTSSSASFRPARGLEHPGQHLPPKKGYRFAVTDLTANIKSITYNDITGSPERRGDHQLYARTIIPLGEVTSTAVYFYAWHLVRPLPAAGEALNTQVNTYRLKKAQVRRHRPTANIKSITYNDIYRIARKARS